MGHQLIIELDLRVTGTERLHVQYRALGERNIGGSYYQFNDPSEFIDNSTGAPDRWWIEGEVRSVLGGFVDPFDPLDCHVVLGKFPFVLPEPVLAALDS